MPKAGRRPTEFVGETQATSNIEAVDDSLRVYQAFISQSFFNDQLKLKIGIEDLNSDFYTNESSSFFLNASAGIGSELGLTGVNGPAIFPYPAPAFIAIHQGDESYAQIGVFSAEAGDPSDPKSSRFVAGSEQGFLLISEFGYQSQDEQNPHRLGFGVWTYTRTFDHLNKTDADGNAFQVPVSGAYLHLDYFWSWGSTFLKYGVGDSKAYDFRDNLVAGLLYKLPDVSGLSSEVGLAHYRLTSSQAKRDQDPQLESSEEITEVSVRFQVTSGLTLQPSFQFVQNPSFSSSTEDAHVFLTRFELSF